MLMPLYTDKTISQETLMELALKWEPEASRSPQKFRKATCVVCAQEMTEMWHCWLRFTDPEGQRWVKELHFCSTCYPKYAT